MPRKLSIFLRFLGSAYGKFVNRRRKFTFGSFRKKYWDKIKHMNYEDQNHRQEGIEAQNFTQEKVRSSDTEMISPEKDIVDTRTLISHESDQALKGLDSFGIGAVGPEATELKALRSLAEDARDGVLDKISERLGSNPGGWYENKNTSERHYIKIYKNPDQARVEFVANDIYSKLGINAVRSELLEMDGSLAIASKAIDGAESMGQHALSKSADVRDGFVADAYLANWDVVGAVCDNIVKDSNGNAHRIDNGGSLIFRARGGAKNFPSDTIGELETMRNKDMAIGQVFGNLTEDEMKMQAQRLINKLSDGEIEDTIRTSGLNPESAKQIETSLKGRRDYLKQRFGIEAVPQVSSKVRSEVLPVLLPPVPGSHAEVPLPPVAPPPPLPKHVNRNLQERTMAAPPDLKETKKATKKEMAEERSNLAREIIQMRNETRASTRETTARLEAAERALDEEKTGWEKAKDEFRDLSISVARQANDLATRIAGTSEWPISKQRTTEEWKATQREEVDELKELLGNDTALEKMREKISAVQVTTEQSAKDWFERQLKTVEQTMARNNAFVVHAFNEPGSLQHHNANSIVGRNATLEDDMDMALALEPSLSCSSIISGKRQGLWSNSMGLIIGGGDIPFAGAGDIGTVPTGIDKRTSGKSASIDVDKIVRAERTSYNELVVDNPKVFGMYQQVYIAEDGSFQISADRVKTFSDRMQLGWKKGIPRFVMTPDRRMFEYSYTEKNGMVVVGKEIHPEDVVKGRAGLGVDDREELGRDVIQRNLFRDIAHHRQSKKRVDMLAGKKTNDIYETTREEYLDQLRKNPKELGIILASYPDEMVHDRSLMLEAARANPAALVSFVKNRSHVDKTMNSLLGDPEFIMDVYAAASPDLKGERIIQHLPESSITKEVYLMALQKNDRMDYSLPSESFLDDPEITNAIIEKQLPLVIQYQGLPWEGGETTLELTQKYKDSSGHIQERNLHPNEKIVQKILGNNSQYFSIQLDGSRLAISRNATPYKDNVFVE